MRRVMDVIYLFHFLSIAAAVFGGFRLLGETRGVGGYDVNPNFAKRVLSHKRAVALGLWGILLTGIALVTGGLDLGFMAERIPFRRHLPPGLLLAYVLVLALLIAAALHPMVAIGYRIVPAILAKPGNLGPEEAGALVRRLRVNAALLVAFVLLALAAGALRWCYSAGLLF